jgi:hypothetical protein
MWRTRLVGICLAAGALVATAAAPADSETVAFFESGAIPVLRLEIPPAGRQRLRDEPREYTRCTLVEDGQSVARVGVKLKGAAGSYRDFDDRPGLTLKLDKYDKGGRWHGMQKLHLNNAVQDETYLSEWLGSRLFQAAGYPAPLAGHVRLWIDDRDLGLYVLREGFDEPFLRRACGTAAGTLYDGGFLEDVDGALEIDIGEDPDDRAELVALAAACHEPDPAVRRAAVEARLDIDRFLAFMALERICGHWDGYSLNRNNYRLWFPAAGRGIFLPHGMDQLFGDPEAGVFDHASPLVAAAVMQDDRWRDRYREKLGDLVRVVRPVDRWLGEVDACHDRIQAILADVDTEAAAAHRDRVAEFKERLVQRFDALDRLVAATVESVAPDRGRAVRGAAHDCNRVAIGGDQLDCTQLRARQRRSLAGDRVDQPQRVESAGDDSARCDGCACHRWQRHVTLRHHYVRHAALAAVHRRTVSLAFSATVRQADLRCPNLRLSRFGTKWT